MPLRLANYQDAYGTTHLAAYAVIERIATDIPPKMRRQRLLGLIRSSSARRS
jgi:hypothetical protein